MTICSAENQSTSNNNQSLGAGTGRLARRFGRGLPVRVGVLGLVRCLMASAPGARVSGVDQFLADVRTAEERRPR